MTLLMRDETGQPVCHRCHNPHSNPWRNYCQPCAEQVLREFGLSHELRTSLAGDPERPVRKVAVTA